MLYFAEMNGTRLGRGRGGRLAVYVGCGMVVILLVFLYRAATSEMARLQELNVQCSHQQEALAAQLQGIHTHTHTYIYMNISSNGLYKNFNLNLVKGNTFIIK